MLFQQRVEPTLTQRARILLWPRRSWDRSLKYISLRLMRIQATPHHLALGFAIGVFASVTPLVGLQMVMAGGIAFVMRASLAAAMLGTFFGNPVVWALVWPTSYYLGCLMLGATSGPADMAVATEALTSAADFVWPILKPMLVGTIPVGLIISSVVYHYSKKAAAGFQERRKQIYPQGCGYPLGGLLATYDPAH